MTKINPASNVFLLATIACGLDFKASESGSGFFIQAPMLIFYFISAMIIFKASIKTKTSTKTIRTFSSICLMFLVPSILIGAFHGQDLWALFTNSISLLIFISAAFSTLVVLKIENGSETFLNKLKTACLAFIVLHFLVILIARNGISLDTSRYEVLSGAVIPASAIFVIGFFIRFRAKDVIISVVNIALILASVTRTQLAVMAGQIACVFAALPSLVFKPSIIRKIAPAILIFLSIIAVDIGLETGLTNRWISRFDAKEQLGADPTALTRLAEVDFMLNSFISSFDRLLFGNGLAAETKLTGDYATLAGSLVGFGSVLSVHSKGYGHNNHASLLFIGGLFFGLPLLLLNFINGMQSLKLIRTLLLHKKASATLVYIGLWGALIVIGELTCGFFSGTFSDRSACLWYGIGTGMLYWAREEILTSQKERNYAKPLIRNKEGGK